MSRHLKRHRRKKTRKKKWPHLILAVLGMIILALVASVLLGFNPFLERQLRAQFGADFFSDFGALQASGEGDDLESIIDDYKPVFQDLEDRAMQRLDSLFTAALEDYHKQEREGTLDRFMLTNKYIQAGRILEKNVDASFYELLGEMKAELERKGLPVEVTCEIDETYKAAKADKKRDLLDRLRRNIGE
jgi:hypothetical protein